MRKPAIRITLTFILSGLALTLLLGVDQLLDRSKISAATSRATGTQFVYLPFVANQSAPSQGARRVNIPHFDGAISDGGSAILWFGRITPTENYSDLRVGYNESELYVHVNTADRRIWYNTSPSINDLTNWDAVALYLDVADNTGSVPDASSYRFVAQFSNWEDRTSGKWQAAFQGNGTDWALAGVPFTTQSYYRGFGGPNEDADNDGWNMLFHIPFTSLGLAGPPSPGTPWRMGLVLYDRDDAAGTPIPNKTWPEALAASKPSTWAQLSFGLMGPYSPTPATARSIVTIRNGLDGQVVPDGEVGGGTVCGEGLDRWTQWGNKNYVGQTQINVQNQADVADWPCFSKYYITFPLSTIPSGKVIISSTLTLYQFGNSGQGWDPGPYPSLIQVLTVNEDWNEATITWNNAPLAAENVSEAIVDPIDYVPAWPGIPRTWDVSRAVASAYAADKPLRLVLYSADSPMHSGKYFYSSDADPEGRPTLQVLWGDP